MISKVAQAGHRERPALHRSGRWVAVGLGALAIGLLNPASANAQVAEPAQPEEQVRPVDIPEPPADAALPEVEPIIDDEEFESAIPDLDTADDEAMDAPFETVEEFERRLAEEEADADPEQGVAPPLNDPTLADEDPIEPVGDAPVRDAELVEPLTPIDQFEVEPVEFAEEAVDRETTEVRYEVALEGIDEADEETEKNLRDMFDDLSALRDGDGKAANNAMIAARLEEDSELVKTILASEGWFDPQVSTRIDRSDTETGQPFQAVIAVSPGTRFVLSSIEIVAPPTDPEGLIRDAMALEVGEPIVAERVQGAEANIAVTLPENGYPFAEVGQRDILLDQDTGEGEYTLPVDAGPRSVFGGFATEGDLAFDADHVETLARFERGELWDSRDVDDLRKALVATGLLSTVSVEPKLSGMQDEAGNELVTVFVEQDAGPPRTIAGSAGYGTGEGFTIEGTWTHRNLFPPEGALIGHAIAGTKQQGAGVTFRRSNAGRRDRAVEFVIEALHSDFDAYDAFTGRLGGQISYVSTPLWQKTFTYGFGFELLGTAERDYDFELMRRDRKTYYIGGINGQAALDLTDDMLDPTKGVRLKLFARPEGSLQGNFDFHVKTQVDASGYFPLGDSFVLAGRARVGSILGAGRADIAPSRRFYAGGGGSVRGFGYQQLGPLDPFGDPIGGRSLNEAAVEGRYRFGNFGAVAFVDVGQSYASSQPQFSDLRYGVGIGARYYTNFGPLRIDVATPMDRREGESRINVYVSIGQAF